MGDLNDRPTVDEAVRLLWEKSPARVFAVGPAAWLPINGKAARHIYFMIASADATREAQLYQIPLEHGLDHSLMRMRFIVAIKALGPCAIHDSDNEADFIEFCATTWPGEKTARLRAVIEAQESAMGKEAEPALAEEFSNLKRQIEAFVLDRAKDSLASSRVMNSNWHQMLETISEQFAFDMNSLEASDTINQAKVRALGSINNAFSIGVLIGRSVPDDAVDKILTAANLVRMDRLRNSRKPHDEYADAKLTEAVQKAMNEDKTRAAVSDAYVKRIEHAVRNSLRDGLEQPNSPIRKPKGWPSTSTIKEKVRQEIERRKG
jgi:hypothetical protein